MSQNQVDQDALAAEWGQALESDATSEASGEPSKAPPVETVSEEMAAQWAAMIDDGNSFSSVTKGGAERVLNQEEIDTLLGFSMADVSINNNSGIRAIIDSAMVSYERLPMLEIVFDRLVRLMTTSLRNFTSDNVEVSLDRITSVRFGDYLNSIPLPAVLAVFKAEEWDNFGLFTVDSSLIYSMIDVLLGGRRGQSAIRIEGRPYTTIETSLVKRMIEVVLADAELAFKPLSPVKFNIDRLETNPRFAAISRPANAAILVRLRIDMEDRGGNVELLLPYATIEPIREIAEPANARGIPLFVDAVASGGWLPIDVQAMGVKLLSLSPHRFYGSKGVGVLYRHRRTRLSSVIHGGVQEGGLRAGTENVAAIVGAGVAAEVASRDLTQRVAHTARLQTRLWEGIKAKVEYVKLNGPEPGPKRIGTNLNVSVEFIEGEGLALVGALVRDGGRGRAAVADREVRALADRLGRSGRCIN